MSRYILGISDTRKITGALKERGYPDFADYALTSLKRRLELVIEKSGLHDTGAFIYGINNDDEFPDMAADAIAVETTELFRDPSMWRMLRDEILPDLFYKGSEVVFWLPGCSSPEDLVSLLILLRESGLRDRSAVMLTAVSRVSLDKIIKGGISKSKLEVSEANYKKFQGSGNLSDYLITTSDSLTWKSDLLSGVKYEVQKSALGDYPGNIDCILYMDKMIYFNPSLSSKVLSKIHISLSPGGYLVTGSGESPAHSTVLDFFSQADKNEKIFKKVR